MAKSTAFSDTLDTLPIIIGHMHAAITNTMTNACPFDGFELLAFAMSEKIMMAIKIIMTKVRRQEELLFLSSRSLFSLS